MAPTTKSTIKKSVRTAGRHITNVMRICDDIDQQSSALEGIYKDVWCKQHNETQSIMKKWANQKRRTKKMTKELNELYRNGETPTNEYIIKFLKLIGVTETIVDQAFTDIQNEQETQTRLLQTQSRLVENLKQCFGNIKSADLSLMEAQMYLTDGSKGSKAPIPATFGYVAHSHESRSCEMHNRMSSWDTLLPADNSQLRLKKRRTNKRSTKKTA